MSYESVRTLLAIAVHENLSFLQFDVSTAYLNSCFKETTSMRIFYGLNVEGKNLKLNKAIYGFKQVGRCWNEKLDSFMKGLGFEQSSADKLYK